MKGAPLRAFGAGLQQNATTTTTTATAAGSTTTINKKLNAINKKK